MELKVTAEIAAEHGLSAPEFARVQQILGRDSAPDDRSIDVHISNLRKKLGRAADGSDRIRAIRGIGYIFVVPAKSKSR